jgi:hypothetical protein
MEAVEVGKNAVFIAQHLYPLFPSVSSGPPSAQEHSAANLRATGHFFATGQFVENVGDAFGRQIFIDSHY